jgi:hypothetical protein
MPIVAKSSKPVAMAQTPEFKALQEKVVAAKAVLDEVMTAIAALESKAPNSNDQLTPEQPKVGVQETIKYKEDATLARIVQLTGQ